MFSYSQRQCVVNMYGAFDPLRAIGRIAKKYNLWYHIDGSWGGSVIFSKKRLPLLDGSEMVITIKL